jgi:hypothetical protein
LIEIKPTPVGFFQGFEMSQTMLQRIEQYLALANTIQPDWADYVIDKSQPLNDRWETFLKAPKEWRSEGQWTEIPFDCLCDVFDSPYDNFNMDRGNTMEVPELFDRLKSKVRQGVITQAQYEEAQEEAMASRFGSWSYDW